MSWNYEEWLKRQLYIAQEEVSLSDFKIEVANEQMFSREQTLFPRTIYVVIKYLTSSISYGTRTAPVQIMILTEQNDLQATQLIFNKFAETNNWKTETFETTFVKQQYTNPVILSNFNEVNFGYRSVLYMSATLFIMDNVIDIKNLKIDGESIEDALNVSMSYSMSGNTQQMAHENLSTTVKSVSSLALTMSLPFRTIHNTLINDIIKIMNGTEDGNKSFRFEFELNGIPFDLNLKLNSSQLITAPNSVPGLQLGFIL